MKWTTYREEFNKDLTNYLQSQVDALDPYFFDERIKKTLEYLTTYSQWGKRIRPYLVYALHTAYNGTTDGIDDLCMAVELVHLFALVHDDIMDKGTTRHSQPTFHKYVESLYDNAHVWESQAILIGDILYTWANELVACSESIPYETKKIFFSLLKEVTFWQMIDVHLSYTDWTEDPAQIQWKDKMKSWFYTFMRPIMLWASMAKVENILPVQTMWAKLWLAFQMRDDLLDITDRNTNKTYFSDLQEWNQTIIWDEVLKRVSPEHKTMILSCRGQQIDSSKQEEIYTIIENSGAIEATKDQVNTLLDEATSELSELFGKENEMSVHIQEVIDFMRV